MSVTVESLLDNKISYGFFADWKNTFLDHERMDPSDSVIDMDVVDERAATYNPVTDEFENHSTNTALTRSAMNDPIGAMASVNLQYAHVGSPTMFSYRLSAEEVSTNAEEVAQLLKNIVTVGQADLSQHVDELLNRFFVHPTVASQKGVYTKIVKSLNSVLDDDVTLNPGERRMMESMLNRSNLLLGTTRSSQSQLLQYDVYGRPLFEHSIVVPNKPLKINKNSGNVILRPMPLNLQPFACAEDVFIPNYMSSDELRRISEPLQISMPTNELGNHKKFLLELKRMIAYSIQQDNVKSMVSVRFDVGNAAGSSGFDTFAPHLVFELSDSDSLLRRRSTLGEEPNAQRPRTAGAIDTMALNGDSSIVTRFWGDTIKNTDADSPFESTDGVENVDPTPSVLFGNKVRPLTPRFAEPIVEHYLNTIRSSPLLHLSAPMSNAVFQFGDVKVPETLRMQMSDDTNNFYRDLHASFTTADAPDGNAPPFGFTSTQTTFIVTCTLRLPPPMPPMAMHHRLGLRA